MNRLVMLPLAKRLEAMGFETQIVTYKTTRVNRKELFAKIDDALSDDKLNVILGHSLGGVMGLEYLKKRGLPTSKVSHLITLGSPLNGSSIAQRLVDLRIGKYMGESLSNELKPRQREWLGQQKLGSMTGNLPIGFRGVLLPEEMESDGTVAVAETKIDGMSDHVVVPSSHTSIIYSQTTPELVKKFIEEGSF
jgi:hypothetical protein